MFLPTRYLHAHHTLCVIPLPHSTLIFPSASDIDIVVIGRWHAIPLRTLAKRLEEKGIPKSMRLIETARVSVGICARPAASVKRRVTEEDTFLSSPEILSLPELSLVQVPIIKMCDARSNIDVDISFNMDSAPVDSQHVQV